MKRVILAYLISILFLILGILSATTKFSDILGIGDADKSYLYWFIMGLFQKFLVLVFITLAVVFFLSIKSRNRK